MKDEEGKELTEDEIEQLMAMDAEAFEDFCADRLDGVTSSRSRREIIGQARLEYFSVWQEMDAIAECNRRERNLGEQGPSTEQTSPNVADEETPVLEPVLDADTDPLFPYSSLAEASEIEPESDFASAKSFPLNNGWLANIVEGLVRRAARCIGCER